MNLFLSIFCLLLWDHSPQHSNIRCQDSRITQIEILPTTSQADLDQMVQALAEDNIQLQFSQTTFSGGKLDRVQGSIQFDEENTGSFSARGLVRIKITWEWKGDILENLQIIAEGDQSSKNVNTQH